MTGLTTKYALHQNSPNPFNPSTVIGYDVPASGGVVSLRIYDVSGRLKRTLVSGQQNEGRHSVTWDGRDHRGQPLPSGTYFYQMRTNGFFESRKLMLMK